MDVRTHTTHDCSGVGSGGAAAAGTAAAEAVTPATGGAGAGAGAGSGDTETAHRGSGAGSASDTMAGFEDFVDIKQETQVWGCPECKCKKFIVVDSVRACAECVDKELGSGSVL